MLRLPVRVRLTIVFAAAMAVILIAVGGFLYIRLSADLLEGIDMSLSARAQTLAHAIEGGAVSVESASLLDPDESLAQVITPAGQVLDATSGLPNEALIDPVASAGPSTFSERTIPTLEGEDRFRLLSVPAETDEGPVIVIVGATLSDRGEALATLLVLMAIVGPVALVLASLGGWWLAGAALRPVDRMREESEAISVSEPERRLPVPPGDDELARLGTTLNAMLDRLQEAYDRERSFVDRASHELRTPLAVMKAELELAQSRERTPEELREALRSAGRETDRLVLLAEDLLVLARARDGRLPVRREETEIGPLLGEVADAWRPKMDAAGTRLVIDAASAEASVDPVRIRQAIDDLLDNALRHGGPPSTVRVTAAREDGVLEISVRDDGPGFGPRAPDGTGLGLEVVRSIAEAHGGSIAIDGAPGRGSGASVKLVIPSA